MVEDPITLSAGPLYSAISKVPPKLTIVPITFALHVASFIFMCSNLFSNNHLNQSYSLCFLIRLLGNKIDYFVFFLITILLFIVHLCYSLPIKKITYKILFLTFINLYLLYFIDARTFMNLLGLLPCFFSNIL